MRIFRSSHLLLEHVVQEPSTNILHFQLPEPQRAKIIEIYLLLRLLPA